MKTIIFFRHGKSDWNANYEQDADRPLKKRGRKAAERMGRFLSAAGPVPDVVFTSPAVRARTTALLAAKAGDWRVPVQQIPALYEGSPEVLLATIRQTEGEVDCLMLVGHEPVWSETTGYLAGEARLRFPTAAMARVDVDVERWEDVEFGSGTLVWLVPPRLLENEP